MPIRPELRKFYGKTWREVIRPRILSRAGNKCEQCGKPNGRIVKTSTTMALFGYMMFWAIPRPNASHELWNDNRGRHCEPFGKCITPAHEIRVVLTVAHLNHTPGDDRDENLRALCQWCHLHHDLTVHVRHAAATRATRKDAARPLLVDATQ